MTERKRTQTEEFTDELSLKASRYGVHLSDESIKLFRDYFDHLTTWNARLHLVAPCPPSEFATRHVLESLTAVPYLKDSAKVLDVGSGSGLPIIPCLIARPDLTAVLIEASSKKAIFLREALRRLELHTRAEVVAARFEETPPPVADAVTCRALERFTELLPALVSWAASVRMLLLFGGPALGSALESLSLAYHAKMMPDSERRFLYIVERDSRFRP